MISFVSSDNFLTWNCVVWNYFKFGPQDASDSKLFRNSFWTQNNFKWLFKHSSVFFSLAHHRSSSTFKNLWWNFPLFNVLTIWQASTWKLVTMFWNVQCLWVGCCVFCVLENAEKKKINTNKWKKKKKHSPNKRITSCWFKNRFKCPSTFENPIKISSKQNSKRWNIDIFVVFLVFFSDFSLKFW